MKSTHVNRFLPLLLLTGLAAMPASALTMTYDPSLPSLYQNVVLTFDGTARTTYAGQIGVDFSNGTMALLFCVAPFTELRTDAVEVNVLNTDEFPNGGRLAWMFNNFAYTITTTAQAAAFQVAAWDVVSDNGDGLASGRIQSNSSTDSEVATLANLILTASAGQSDTGARFYTPVAGPEYSQTLFNAIPSSTVPEPATFLTLGAGLIALSRFRRTRQPRA